MLDKLGGKFAPRPSTGPHKFGECLPLVILLRNRLKYALSKRDVIKILMQRLIRVDGKIRTDLTYPAGFMDVISIPKTKEFFRLIYDVKGRFQVHRITEKEAEFKLCKIKKVATGPSAIPYCVTHDGRTLRYPDPLYKQNDTIKLNIKTGKIMEHVKFEVGNLIMVTGGRNLGRVGVLEKQEKHPGSFDIVHVKDASGVRFATRLQNVFVIGKGHDALVSLPARKGIKLSVLEQREYDQKKNQKK